MQIISLDSAALPSESGARNLLENYAFVSDAWPQWTAGEAALHTLEHLPDPARISVLQEGDTWLWMAVLAPLEFDSRLFERPVARLWPLVHRTPWPAAREREQGRELVGRVVREAREQGLACIMARIPARDFLSAQALEACGFLLHDVSVEWLLDLQGLPARGSPPPGLEVRPWREADRQGLLELVPDSFCDLMAYADRFALDPRLRPHCRRMYRRWTANSLDGRQADQVLVLAREGVPAGLITLRLPRDTSGPGADCGWVVINAIQADLRHQGLYRRLLLSGLHWLRQNGAGRARVRTKVSQQAVIRAWSHLGASQVYSDLTFHLWLEDTASGPGQGDQA